MMRASCRSEPEFSRDLEGDRGSYLPEPDPHEFCAVADPESHCDTLFHVLFGGPFLSGYGPDDASYVIREMGVVR